MTRYAPSEKKLVSYLEKKKYSGNIPDFLMQIGYSEDMMLDMWIRSFLSGGKWEREMKLKLMKKEFPKEKVIEKIEWIQEEIRDWKYHEKMIEKQIQDLLGKGKSKMMIWVILGGKYPYFRDEIKEILHASSDTSGLEKEIEKYRKKYNLSDRSEEKKFYDALMRKWFRWKDIKNWSNKNTN